MITVKMSKRQMRSNKFAQQLCREIRASLAESGSVDWEKAWPHFNSWMSNTDKQKFVRPKMRRSNWK